MSDWTTCCSPTQQIRMIRSIFGMLGDAGLAPHQSVAAVDDLLLGRGVHDLPGAGRERPALGEVEVLEARPVLPVEDVLRDDRDADVVLVGDEVEEARGRRLERRT